jgi:hypothetical protein
MLTLFDETTLRQMVALRRRKATVTRRDPTSPDRPTFRLWGSAEHVIFSLARYVALLQRDGLSEPQALVHIDRALGLDVFPQGHVPQILPRYLATVLAGYHPDYLTYGPELLNAAAALAQSYFAEAVSRPRESYPPKDWLGPRIELQRFRSEYAEHLSAEAMLFPRSSFEAEVADLAVRWQEGDELRSFSSPSRSWQMKVGSAGVALVRRGRPIAHLLIWMN